MEGKHGYAKSVSKDGIMPFLIKWGGVRPPKATFLMGTEPLCHKSLGKPSPIVHGPGPSKLWL